MAAMQLSPRETTVLHFIAWGYTNKEIANRLDLSVKTIEAHKANGMRKLSLAARADLVRKAVDWGWLVHGQSPSVQPQSRGQLVSTETAPSV
jgi:DNA-binding NarL/FixJ family response regulator